MIGGNGSITGASIFSKEFYFPTIGIPASIDNDIYGTENTIGFHTALETIVQSIDKIRDTARSHNRLFFVEVMGRHNGNLALYSGLASGACHIILPEIEFSIDDLVNRLKEGKKLKKSSSIVIVAEGNTYGPSYKIAQDLSKVYSEYESKVTILGHLQRGGSPTSTDRILASRMGFAAVNALITNKLNTVVGIVKNRIIYNDMQLILNNENEFDHQLYKINEIISR